MRFSRWFGLRNKFILVSVLNILVPLILVAGVSMTQIIHTMERQVSRSNYQTVEQVADNISMLFSDMKNSSVYLLQNKEFMSYLRLPAGEIARDPGHLLSVQKFIYNYLAFNRNIHSIYLESFNGMTFDSQSAKNTISDELRAQLTLLRGEGILLPDVITNYNGTQTGVFSFVKIIKDTENLAVDLALLKINIPESVVADTFQGKLLSPGSDYFMIDASGAVISSLHKDMIGSSLAEKAGGMDRLAGEGGYFQHTIDGESSVVTYRELFYPSWKLVNVVPLSEISREITGIRHMTTLCIALSLLAGFVMVSAFSIRVFGPLKKLRVAMGKLENEDFDVNIEVRGNDEIAMLAGSFNKMSRKLDELVNEVLAVQIRQKEAELKALQAQINPHFLYNTLDTIYWNCRTEGAEDSARLVKTLSGLFRLSLNNGSEFTSLQRELEHLELYIAIQQKRFGSKVSFHLDVEEHLLGCQVVKLVLQPLVENSLTHGLEKNGGAGHVAVHVFEKDGKLIYTVKDDGAGAKPGDMEECLHTVGADHRGFAINNVNERIRIYHGEGYGLSFETAPGRGMTVTVAQPILCAKAGEWEEEFGDAHLAAGGR